jgi:hypothetical protein
MSAPVAFQNPTSAAGSGPAVPKINQAAMSQGDYAKRGLMTSNTGAALNRWTDYIGSGGGSTRFWSGAVGRGSVAMRSNANNSLDGGGLLPPDWLPQLTPAVGQNPGSIQDAGALVAVYDFHLWWQIAGASPMTNNMAGIWFLPLNAGVNAQAVPVDPAVLPFSNRFSGFGCFLNNVGGLAAYEYVSFRNNGGLGASTILEQVPVPVATVPTVNQWNTIRFVIIGATNTAGATVQMIVNGDAIVPGRAFGSALLDTPEASVANAPGFACGFNTGGVDFVNAQWAAKLGRFNPSGAAIEAA